MNLDPKMGQADRLGSAIGGVGLLVYAVLGNHDQVGARVLLAILGVAFAIGGLGGT